MKRAASLVLCSLLGACAGSTPQTAPAPASAPPRPRAFEVTYRDPANVFEILDNVSQWLPDKADDEYRAHWKEKIGLDAEDERRFSLYKSVRERYYAPEAESRDLFAKAKPADRVAEAFYAAPTREAAFASLATFMSREDVDALRAFYAAYDAKLRPLLDESRAYASIATAMQRRLDEPRVLEFVQRLQAFYGVHDASTFTVLYVWWPPAEHTAANDRGRFLLLKYNPTRDAEDATRDFDIPVHELTHRVSAQQPDAQKRALTETFLAGCKLPGGMGGPKVLEEPLAVVHQKLVLRAVDPSRLDFSRTWYGDPWVSTFAKLLYGQVAQAEEGDGKLDETFARRAARSCAQLVALAGALR